MLIGRLCGGFIGGRYSSRQQITVVAALALIFVLIGMLLPNTTTINMPGVDWGKLHIVWAQVLISVLFFILVGLCTSVMWGGIFNMAVEGLGKYTSIASGAFMTMVFGCGVLIPLQGWVADLTHNYLTSYFVVIVCAAYILFYALIGSRNVNKDIPTT